MQKSLFRIVSWNHDGKNSGICPVDGNKSEIATRESISRWIVGFSDADGWKRTANGTSVGGAVVTSAKTPVKPGKAGVAPCKRSKKSKYCDSVKFKDGSITGH